MALAVVALIGVVSGVAIAGWPDAEPVAETITAPGTTVGGATPGAGGPTSTGGSTTVPSSTTTTTLAATTTSSTTTTTTTTSTTTTTAATTTTTTTTTAAPRTTTSTTTAPRTTTTSTTAAPTTPPRPPLADRSEMLVLAVNGAGTPGLGRKTAWKLREMGYDRAFYDDGTGFADVTRVYVREGLEAEGRRLARDLDLTDRRPRPLDEAPRAETGIPGVDLFVYLGTDFH